MSVVKGKAKRFNGTPIDYVLLFDWVTGARLGKSVPDSLGNWRFYFQSNLKCGITYVADGCEPISHGAYDLAHIVLPEFVDYIGSVNSIDRGAGSASMLTTIPATVQAGDMLVLAVMRRGAVTVTDSNGGVWTLGADSIDVSIFNQGTSIYYRTAIAGDAGKVISVATGYAGRLITYFSVYRGKYKQLKVTESFSNPVRYDETYKDTIKNLAPIAHNGGFMIRSASTVFVPGGATTSGTTISNMTNIGATLESPLEGVNARLQVAYKHLATADIFSGVVFNTGVAYTDNVTPDAAIILNEV